MKRTCPRDRTPLVQVKLEGVTVDECPKCGGAFFDEAELGRATGDKELAKYLSQVHGAAGSPMVCPACGHLMDLDKVGDVETAATEGSEDQDVSAGRRGGYVEIDHCTSCRGVWLDKGEMDRLGKRGEAALEKGFTQKERAAEERRYGSMPRGGGGGRFAGLAEAFRNIAWKLKKKR